MKKDLTKKRKLLTYQDRLRLRKIERQIALALLPQLESSKIRAKDLRVN